MTALPPDDLDNIIIQALREFTASVREENWVGREREAISVYTFSHLIRRCNPNSQFHDPGQVCIEGAVPPNSTDKKPQINKDLIVWENAKMNCWILSENSLNVVNYPLLIMQWKVLSFWRELKHPEDPD